MDALGISLYDLVLVAGVSCRCFTPFTMTPGAKVGDIGCKGCRLGIGLPLDTVGPVAFLAGRRVGIILGEELPVRALLVFHPDLGMTGRAINFLSYCLAGTQMGGVNAGMALAACNFKMPRMT